MNPHIDIVLPHDYWQNYVKLISANLIVPFLEFVLFLGLSLLYGLMVLMTAVGKDRPSGAVVPVSAEGEELDQQEPALQAAVIAVALARAEQEKRTIGVGEPQETMSAWRAFHHHRQLTSNQRVRRAR